PTEQADLRDVGRAQAGLTALAFDRLDHRRLFATDVGAGAATQMDDRDRARWVGTQRRDLVFEDLAATVIFVAKVDIDLADTDGPGRDQRAFEKAVGVALEIVAVLEGARFAFVDVDRQQPWRGASRHRFPLAASRKAGAAKPTQARIFHRRDDLVLC